jgi:protein-S-isoprenylcysteine O-methyltransferase Ste14
LLLAVPSYFVLHFCVIKREEKYLERKFGEEYRLYKARVPRYVRLFRRRTSSQARSGRRQEI